MPGFLHYYYDCHFFPIGELLAKLRKEHERCLQIKSERMDIYIEAVQNEIRGLVDQMFIGALELDMPYFSALRSVIMVEALLLQLEKIYKQIINKYMKFEPLYKKCEQWMAIHFSHFDNQIYEV